MNLRWKHLVQSGGMKICWWGQTPVDLQACGIGVPGFLNKVSMFFLVSEPGLLIVWRREMPRQPWHRRNVGPTERRQDQYLPKSLRSHLNPNFQTSPGNECGLHELRRRRLQCYQEDFGGVDCEELQNIEILRYGADCMQCSLVESVEPTKVPVGDPL